MKINQIIYAFLPGIGMGTRFRICIRLHEFFRKNNMEFLNCCLKAYMQKKYGCEISCHASISPSSIFMHTVGVVIGEGVIVEEKVTIFSGVVLGRKNIAINDDYPIIKKGSTLCAGCKVLGKIVVEADTIIGANAVVTSSCLPGGGTYVGIPAHRL